MYYDVNQDNVEIIPPSESDIFDKIDSRLKDTSLKGIIYKFLFTIPGIIISVIALVILISLLISIIATIIVAAIALIGTVVVVYFVVLWLIQPIVFFSEVFKKLIKME